MTYYEKYIAKRAEIEKSRLEAFSSIGLVTRIGGVLVYQLTLQAWVDLRLTKNGMLTDEPSEEAVYKYILRNHVDYPLGEWAKFKLERTLSNAWKSEKKAEQLIFDLYNHFNSAFEEMPEAQGDGSTFKSNKIREVEGVVAVIDELSSRYGIHPDSVSRMPLRQAFALQKASRLATIPDYKLLEPQALRDIKDEHLRSKNNG